MKSPVVILFGTRWYGVLGPCKLLIHDLVSKGYRVVVAGASDNLSHVFDTENIELLDLPLSRSYFSFFSDVRCIYTLYSYCLNNNVICLHSFNPKPSLLATIVKLFCPRLKFFLGVTGMGNTFIRLKSFKFLLYPFFQLSARISDKIHVQNIYDALIYHSFGAKLSDIFLFESPGIDPSSFPSRSFSNCNDRTLNVLFVGRLLWQKGLRDFLNLLKHTDILSTDNFCFTIVGSLDPNHPDRLLLQDIEEFQSFGIDWIPWTDNIGFIYRRHDVLLFMSEREGGPRAVLEAALSGIPSIASEVPGISNLIAHCQSGFLVTPGDYLSIYKYLQFYRDNINILIQHGQHARNLCLQSRTLSQATVSQLRMYKSIPNFPDV